MTKRPKTRGTRGTGNRAPRSEAQKASLFKPGNCANPGGKRKMPDWLYHAGPSALAMQVAAGTGRIIQLDDDTEAELAARTEQAMSAPANIRQAAAKEVTDRVYGKIKDVIEVDATEESPLLAALIALARPKT